MFLGSPQSWNLPKLGPNIAVLEQRSRDQEELHEFLSTTLFGFSLDFFWSF
jgi:hypothetical protein